MEVNIQNLGIELKYGFKCHMIYERLTGKSFTPSGLNELLIFFYSCVAASDIRFTMPFDKRLDDKGVEIDEPTFLEWLDANPEYLEKFSNWLVSQYTRNESLEEAKKKKKPKK